MAAKSGANVVCMRFILCFLVSGLVEGFGENILNGDKRILIYPDDSHDAARDINPLYLDRYFGGDGKSPFLIRNVGDRHWPIGIDKNGQPSKEIRGTGTPSYLIDGTLSGQIRAAKNTCRDCKVVFVAYAHGLAREMPSGEIISPPNGFIVSDSTDVSQIEQAVEWGKFLVDQIKAEGADYVILSSGTMSHLFNRLVDQVPAAIRAFNQKYGDQTTYWADAVTPTMGHHFRTRMGGDMNHPNRVIGLSMVTSGAYFRAMLAMDGKPVPSWIDDGLMEREKELVETVRKLRYTGPQKGHFALGDVIPFTWEVDCQAIQGKAVVPNLWWWRRDGILDERFPNSARIAPFPWKERCPTAGGSDGKRQGSWCCGEDYPQHGLKWGRIDIEVTEQLIQSLLGKHALKQMNQPFPIIAQIGVSEVYRPDWDASNIDWGRVEEMIVIHPFPTTRMDLPVYPNGYHQDGSVSLATSPSMNRSIHLTPSLAGYSPAWWHTGEFWTIHGKQIPTVLPIPEN